MRRSILISAFLLVGIISSAQTAVHSGYSDKRSFFPVPKELTLTGKPYMSVVDYDFSSKKSRIGVYSSIEPEECLLSFDIPNVQSEDTYYEKASGFTEKVVIKDKFFDGMGDDSCYLDSSLQVIEAGIKKAFGYPDWFFITEFIDADGETGYYGNDYSGYHNDSTQFFFEYEKYGKLYPKEYFSLDTAGKLRYCHFFHYEYEYDFSNATWVKDLDYTLKNNSKYDQYTCLLQNVCFQNADASFYPNYNIVTSQNIFNTDPEWEYILKEVDYQIGYGQPQKGMTDGVVRRSVYLTPVYKGFTVMNSKGGKVLSIPISDKKDEYTVGAEIKLISVFDGKIYFIISRTVRKGALDSPSFSYENREDLFITESPATGVKSISRNAVSRMTVFSSGIDQGDNVEIRVSEPLRGENILISNMSGQIINQTPLGNTERVSIETSAYPKGVYNVILQGKSASENQRIIIK